VSGGGLAGSPGPHVFVESVDSPTIADGDLDHLERSLRMRAGDPLTLSDGQGSWVSATLSSSGQVDLASEWHLIEKPAVELTVAFSLVKGSKPELVVQKLTELGIDRIVGLVADRSVVRWDDAKVAKATQRWERIAWEASMQSHRVRLPHIEGVVTTDEFLGSDPDVAIAHFDATPVGSNHHTVALGPEGGWSDRELDLATQRISLGDTVLRAETAAISAGALLSAFRRSS